MQAVRQYILELDGARYCLTDRTLRTVTSAKDVTGDKWIVSDFESVPPQVLTVEAPLKYVDAVIERRLRENGALIGGGRILVLRKHRRGARITEALFVPVASTAFARYTTEAEDDEHHQILFPLHALLSRELERLESKDPVAMCLVHDRHVDLVVGDRHRTYGALRVTSHRSGSDRKAMINNLVDGIRDLEQQCNIRVKEMHFHACLLEDGEAAAWTEEVASDLGIPKRPAVLDELQLNGQRLYSSLPRLLGHLKPADSASPPVHTGLYLASHYTTWAAAALAGVAVLALGTNLYWTAQARDLAAKSAAIERSLAPPEPAPAVLKAAYEKPLALADMLGRAQISPSVHQVLAEVSASVAGRVRFNELTVAYPADRAVVALTLVGQSEKPAESEGVPALNAFIVGLRQRGYTLVKSDLQTDINAFSFMVQLERGLK